jgi:hypothetical protein
MNLLEFHFPPGLFGDAAGREDIRQPFILRLLAPACQPYLAGSILRWLIRGFKHMPYSWILCSTFTAFGWQFVRLSSPLYGLMASLYRRGGAFTWHLQGRDSHPHGHSVVKVRFGIAP